jgi:hypothetical protein
MMLISFRCFLQVHAFSVCDDPDYFHNFVQGLLDGLKAGVNSGDIVQIQNVSVSVKNKMIVSRFSLIAKMYMVLFVKIYTYWFLLRKSMITFQQT